jgi:CubicO group peptidase (beta-lactamase class C family)
MASKSDLPSFADAAKDAHAKAKAAGAGKFEPGSPKDTERHISAATAGSSSSAGQGQLSDQKAVPIPPVIRSALTFSGQCVMITSRGLGRAIVGSTGGLLYQGRSFCYAAGFRDGSRGFDNEDKGNHLKLRDPVGVHRLTIPMTGLLAWRLHKDKKLDLFRPITEYLPELPRTYDGVICRDILSFRAAVSDEGIFKSVGAKIPSAFDSKRQLKYFENVWQPVSAAFAGKTATESRASLLTHIVKNSDKLPRVRRLISPKGQVSHTAIALLAVAMERVMNDSYESLMEKNVFQIVETPSAGFGAPKIINRSHIFYQPGGLPAGHWLATKAVKPEAPENAAPAVFNSSLNMYANPEEFAKLMIVAFEGCVNAVKEFPGLGGITPYHELGVWYEPSSQNFSISQDMFGNELPTPFSASANYNLDKDVGSFVITNCGSRRARFITNFSSTLTTTLFIKQVINAGVNVWEGMDVPEAQVTMHPRDARTSEQATKDAERMGKLSMDRQGYSKLVGGLDNHTRF